MPLKDSMQSEKTDNEQAALPENVDEMVTPIEANAQKQAELEFETERKIPRSCRKAIVSVNGEDVEQVPIEPPRPGAGGHPRAA